MCRSGLRQRVKELLMTIQPRSFLPTSPSPPLPFAKKPLLLGLANAAPCSPVTMSTTTTTNLDEIFKQKRVLRSKVRKSLKSMDPSLRSQEDDAIQSLVLEAPWFKSSQRLCAYITCSALHEVDTSKLLSQILQNPTKDRSTQSAKKLYVPRVENKNSHMRMLNISSMDDLIANSMDILEPAPVDHHGNAREDVLQANDPVDLFIVPGLAFDKSGRRLGRGGGYYDAFLRKYQELAEERNWMRPLFVALSYSLQIIDDGVIPVTLNDVPVDALVSPAGVIPISQAALNRFDDFCVTYLEAPISVNGFPCKPEAEVTSDDFFFDGLSEEGNTTNIFGCSKCPFFSKPQYSWNFHEPSRLCSHPRATETGVVIERKLLVGFISTSNVFRSKALAAGQMFVVPRGLVHFQLNVGEGKALLFTAFNSHLPGSAIVPTTLFASTPSIPDDVLTKAFQVGNDVIDNIKSMLGLKNYHFYKVILALASAPFPYPSQLKSPD
ncbi:unnamed protein product [Dovyalis caffra]|uniref:5-formyltetrahydrofolate cyclo-ligase n=1 Tax=Dovyalis caffra TaxID=77055 RepID=A0AAV1QMK1_9ROSI|nr:unnamed protein product [Dovyalis caffra]